jgi:ATP dependent DNA ligase C terminal region
MYENSPSDRRCSPRMANHPVAPKRRNHDQPLPSREFFSSLLAGLLKLRLARREGDTLFYVGRVGTGWDRETAQTIRRALEPFARTTAPLAKPLKKADTTWVEPKFDAEITYAEITDDGMVRHPSFKSSCRKLTGGLVREFCCTMR